MRPSRGKAMLFATGAILLLLGAMYHAFLLGPEEQIRLRFEGGDGYQTASGHEEPSTQVAQIITRTGEEYVEEVEFVKQYGTFDGTVATPLLTATVHANAFAPEETVVDTGYATISVEGVLEMVPPVDVQGTLDELTAAGWELLFPSDDEPDPDPEPQPTVFTVEHEGLTVLVIILQPAFESAEVVLLEGGGFGGTHILVTPWVVEQVEADGTLVDLWVRNPVAHAEIGGVTHDIVVERIKCKSGQCIPVREVRPACHMTGACPNVPRTTVASVDHPGGDLPVPGTLVHLWSNDGIHGGAGIQVMDDYGATFAAPEWHGNPFTSEGLWVADDTGARLAGVSVDLPGSDEQSLGVTVTGSVVHALTGDDIAQHADLSEFSFHVNWGPLSLGTTSIYEPFDLAGAAALGTWSDADGQIKGAKIWDLATGTDLAAIVQDAQGTVTATAEAVQAQVVWHQAQIEAESAALAEYALGLTEPAERAAFDIVDVATGVAVGQVTMVQDTLGCELTTLGCVGIVMGIAEGAGDQIPPLPGDDDVPGPDDLGLGDLPFEDADTLVIWVNNQAGTILGLVPPGPETPDCLDADPATCIGPVPVPEEVIGAAIGFVEQESAALVAWVENAPNEDIVHVEDSDGNPLVHIDAGEIHLAGVGARTGEGNLLTLERPEGTQTCVSHTFDAAALADGSFPSVTMGCDGLEGHTFTFQPGADYEIDENGELRELRVYDPAAPGDSLFWFHNDGDSTTIASGFDAAPYAVSVPSTMVALSGNPVTSSAFTLNVAGEDVPGAGVFETVSVAKQTYESGRRIASGLPLGTQTEMLFESLDGPDSDPWMRDGRTTLVWSEGGFNGDSWASGLRDNRFSLTIDDSPTTPELAELVYRIGQPPVHGISPALAMSVVGTDDEAGTRSHAATLPASILSAFQDGARIYVTIAWTEQNGPVAATFLDDNEGDHYRYQLDNQAPDASVTAPSNSADDVFRVRWDADPDGASGLAHFRVQSAESANPGETEWTDWMAARSAREVRFADFQGAPGGTYTFRVQACDNVGNCGAWSAPATTAVDGLAPVTAATLDLSVSAPADGATLTGGAVVAWTVDYAGAATPIVNVHHRADGTTEWIPVYSGTADSVVWQTGHLYDGGYTLRVGATDGAAVAELERSVTLANGVTAPSLDQVAGSGSDQPLVEDQAPPMIEDQPADSKDSPALGTALWLAFLLGVGMVRAVGRRERS